MYKVISDIVAHRYDVWNTIVIAINFCNAKKMICTLICIINNHDGIKLLNHSLLLEPYNVMFKVISDGNGTNEWYVKYQLLISAMQRND